MRAHLLQLLRERDVVFQRILRARRVEDVARVAERAFANSMSRLHRLHRGFHVAEIVERIEHAENIHARFGCVLHKAGHHIRRIARVADGIRAAQEHLETDVGHGLTKLAQTLPRVFVEEAHRCVKRRAAPHFEREKLRRSRRHSGRDGQHVIRADARRHERLMRIAERRVGDEQALLLQRPLGEFLRPELQQQIACALRRQVFCSRHLRRGERLRGLESLRVRIAVHDDVAEEIEQLRRAVAAELEIEQRRRCVDHRGRRAAAAERRVIDHVFHERNVRLHAADSHFAQCAVHAVERHVERRALRRDLYQQRIVKRRNDRTGVAHACIEPHAVAARAAVGDDLAVARRELVCRVFRRHAALHREAAARNLRLRRDAHFLAVERVPHRDENLRAQEVHAGDFLRHRVLHLDARIHLDEEPLVRIEIEQVFHRARVVVANLPRDARRRFAQLVTHLIRKSVARGNLHDLLMPTLHRAIALMQMHRVAVMIAEHLHFDVLCAGDILFQKHRPVSKRPLRLALRFVEQRVEVARLVHHAHSASAAAESRLDDQRKTNLRRDLQRFLPVAHRVFRARQRGDFQLLRQCPRRDFIAHQVEQLRLWPHELNPSLRTSRRKLRILRQKTVARVNHVHALRLRERHDALDIEIRAHRPLPLAHAISLVGLEAVHRKLVLLRINRDRAQTEFRRRTHDTDGDFGAVRDEQFLRGQDLCRFLGGSLRHKMGAFSRRRPRVALAQS